MDQFHGDCLFKGDRKSGTGSPEIKWVRDQMQCSLHSFTTYVLNFYPPKSCSRVLISSQSLYYSITYIFEILILFSESKLSFYAHVLPFHVMIYEFKAYIGILDTNLDSQLKLEF